MAMKPLARIAVRWALLGLGVGIVGCGLINGNITKVTFDLPTQRYSFDVSTLNLPPGNTPAISCGSGGLVADCCNIPSGLGVTAPSCATIPIVCENSLCTAKVPAAQATTITLKQQVPVLQAASSLANLTISQISYVVGDNTLNFDLPPVVLYLAPNGVTDPNDPQAKKFGTVPTIPAGTVVSGTVMLEPDSAATFSAFTQDLSQPFSLIASTTITVPSGSPTPTGQIDISVTGTLSASL